VSEEIADESSNANASNGADISASLEDFFERHGSARPVQLPLPLTGAA
jgi:hypothetical protein